MYMGSLCMNEGVTREAMSVFWYASHTLNMGVTNCIYGVSRVTRMEGSPFASCRWQGVCAGVQVTH